MINQTYTVMETKTLNTIDEAKVFVRETLTRFTLIEMELNTVAKISIEAIIKEDIFDELHDFFVNDLTTYPKHKGINFVRETGKFIITFIFFSGLITRATTIKI